MDYDSSFGYALLLDLKDTLNFCEASKDSSRLCDDAYFWSEKSKKLFGIPLTTIPEWDGRFLTAKERYKKLHDMVYNVGDVMGGNLVNILDAYPLLAEYIAAYGTKNLRDIRNSKRLPFDVRNLLSPSGSLLDTLNSLVLDDYYREALLLVQNFYVNDSQDVIKSVLFSMDRKDGFDLFNYLVASSHTESRAEDYLWYAIGSNNPYAAKHIISKYNVGVGELLDVYRYIKGLDYDEYSDVIDVLEETLPGRK